MKVGQQKRIPATRPGLKQKRPIIGGYNWLKDSISWTTAETKNSAHFIGFLEHLLMQQYPTGRVVLVMDNASYHKSAPALAALSLFEHRVMVIWLPTYCSDLTDRSCVFISFAITLPDNLLQLTNHPSK